MITHNELVIDGVRTSSFPFKIIIKEFRSFELSESKTQLLEHDGINGAILQSNSHRPPIKKVFTFQMVNPSEEELNQFMALLVREKFWLESERLKTTKWWCYKIEATEAVEEAAGLFISKVTFICHPTKFFKTVDSQILVANDLEIDSSPATTPEPVSVPKKSINKETIWIDTSYIAPDYDMYYKYSTHADGRNMGNVPSNYIGITFSRQRTAPENPAEYLWYKLSSQQVSFAWANSKDGKLDYTEVGPKSTAKIVAKARPRVEHTTDTLKDFNSGKDIMVSRNSWDFDKFVRLKPATTYTLTARGCRKGYQGEGSPYGSIFVSDEIEGRLAEVAFKNATYEIKRVTFTTPKELDTDGYQLINDRYYPNAADWSGGCIDWFVLSEGDTVYSDYPNDTPAQSMRYRYFGITTTEVITQENSLETPPVKMQSQGPGRSGGVVKTQGSALAFPKIIINGNSSERVSFTIGDQRIELESLIGEAIMINDPNSPSFKMANGDFVKWSGDFITIDPIKNSRVGVAMSAGIESLKFETVWGWA